MYASCYDFLKTHGTRVHGLCPEAFGRMAEWQNTSARLFVAWQKA